MSSEQSPKKTEEKRGNRWTNQPANLNASAEADGRLTNTTGTTLDIGVHDLKRLLAQGLTFQTFRKF